MNNLYQRLTPESYSLISKLQEKDREIVMMTLEGHHSYALVAFFEAKLICKILGLPQDFQSFESLFIPIDDNN